MGMTIDIEPEEIFDQWCESIGRRGGAPRMSAEALGDRCYQLLDTASNYNEMADAIMHLLAKSDALMDVVIEKIKEKSEPGDEP